MHASSNIPLLDAAHKFGAKIQFKDHKRATNVCNNKTKLYNLTYNELFYSLSKRIKHLVQMGKALMHCLLQSFAYDWYRMTGQKIFIGKYVWPTATLIRG
jgi:hypothetical protein